MGIGTSLKKILGGIAPTIGAAVGGPFGGIAMKFLADKFTGGETGKVEDFLLSSNPETLKELKVAELEFQKHLKELDVDLEKIHAGDRDSAREMAIKTTLMPQMIIAATYLLGYFSALGYLIYLAASGIVMSEQLADLIKTLMAAFSVGIPIILQFFFGSSSGSKEKTAAMAKNGD